LLWAVQQGDRAQEQQEDYIESIIFLQGEGRVKRDFYRGKAKRKKNGVKGDIKTSPSLPKII
jgi:hypothetical protein